MKPRVDINICEKIKCDHFIYDGGSCSLMGECIRSKERLWNHYGCLLPDKCLYKAVQVAAVEFFNVAVYKECRGCKYYPEECEEHPDYRGLVS